MTDQQQRMLADLQLRYDDMLAKHGFTEYVRGYGDAITRVKSHVAAMSGCGYEDCDGGTIDSGGSQPWGEAIRVPCPNCASDAKKDDGACAVCGEPPVSQATYVSRLRDVFSEVHAAYLRVSDINAYDGWKVLYDAVFPGYSTRVREILEEMGQAPLDWHDPDRGYEDDVRAYYLALDAKLKQLMRVFGVLDK